MRAYDANAVSRGKTELLRVSAAAAAASPAFLRLSQLYFFWNFSTRPVVSTNFILPVKNGWQAEQISTVMFFLRAARDELVAATAGDGGFHVFGVNAVFHEDPLRCDRIGAKPSF